MREGSIPLLGNTGSGVVPGAYPPTPHHNPLGGTFALQSRFGTYFPKSASNQPPIPKPALEQPNGAVSGPIFPHA